MANWFIPDEGLKLLLQRGLFTTGVSAAEDYHLKGFSNNHTPAFGDTTASYTESAFTGYASVAITHSSFPAPTTTAPGASTTSSTPAVFTCTSGAAENMYGVYLVGDTSGKVIAAGKFDNVRSMAPGATETVTVSLADLTL